MQDLIFVSLEDWDEVWRRNQFLCTGLAKRHPHSRILFVGLPRDYSHGLRSGNLSCFTQPAVWKVPQFPNITVTHPPKLLPNSFALGRRFNEWLFRRHVKIAVAKLGIKQPMLWLNPHSAVHMVHRTDECAVIYDITDDWTAFNQSPKLTALIKMQDQALCRLADAVIVCSERLAKMKSSLAQVLHCIPNGVNAAHYQRVNEQILPMPEDAKNWPRPVLGYTGTIHSDRVDLLLLEDLAKRLPHATIALVGPIMITALNRRRLEATGNVVFTGAKPYTEIPDYMRAFDVCITPHMVTPFTESLNPIKLWEYLAAGKPIIATPVAGFRDYPELVYLATSAESFAQKITQALTEDSVLAIKRREEALRHSWDIRLDAVEAVMAQCATIAPKLLSLPDYHVQNRQYAITAVIVNYNTKDLTLKCLHTLMDELASMESEVFVVDNASSDGSVEAIRSAFPAVQVLASKCNAGFGVANNLAFQQAKGRYLLLLNSDAFPRAGAVADLVDFLDQHENVGVVGPRLVNPDDTLQRSCFRFTTPLQAWLENLWLTKMFSDGSRLGDYRHWSHETERDVDFIIGACLLVRRKVYEQVGGFDERFFMYQEEADWQRRIKAAGWRVVFTPRAEVMHIAGASGKDEPVRVNEHFFDSLDKYLLKHHGILGFLLLRSAMVVGCLLRSIGWAVMALLPHRRQGAGRRARQHVWLLGRQLLKRPPSTKRI